MDRCAADAEAHGTNLLFTSDPLEAVSGVDVIVTDTWVSMGQEEEKQKRLKDFAGYQVRAEATAVASGLCQSSLITWPTPASLTYAFKNIEWCR